MRVEDTKDFRKALRKLPTDIQKAVLESVENIVEAASFTDIRHLKALTGHPNHYRIRIRSYRMGLFWDGEIFVLESIGVRGDFYKTYP